MWTTVLVLGVTLAATPVTAAGPEDGCALAACLPAVESFPPEPCTQQAIPRQVRRRMQQARAVIQAQVDGQETGPRPAHHVLKWLNRASRDTTVAAAEGTLTGECATILAGLLRNARACAACPALKEGGAPAPS